MPITTARAGVFRGRAFDLLHWVVVDPSHDPELVRRRWSRRFALTNTRLVRLGAALAATALVAALAFVPGLPDALMGSMSASPGAVVATAVSLILVLVTLATAGADVLARRAVDRHGTVDEASTIDPSIAAWADDATPISTLWELSSLMRDVKSAYFQTKVWRTPDSAAFSEGELHFRRDVLAEAEKDLAGSKQRFFAAAVAAGMLTAAKAVDDFWVD